MKGVLIGVICPKPLVHTPQDWDGTAWRHRTGTMLCDDTLISRSTNSKSKNIKSAGWVKSGRGNSSDYPNHSKM